MADYVMAHRIVLKPELQSEVSTSEIVRRALESVEVPKL